MLKLGYVTLGSRDIEKASEFYEAFLGELGCQRFMDFKHFKAWGTQLGEPFIALCSPENREPATVGNGTMIALECESHEQVDGLHAKALQLGAQDEGAPGYRPAGYYCAYFRDPDGNKLNLHATN